MCPDYSGRTAKTLGNITNDIDVVQRYKKYYYAFSRNIIRRHSYDLSEYCHISFYRVLKKASKRKLAVKSQIPAPYITTHDMS